MGTERIGDVFFSKYKRKDDPKSKKLTFKTCAEFLSIDINRSDYINGYNFCMLFIVSN